MVLDRGDGSDALRISVRSRSRVSAVRVPELAEQRAIADFLDAETARIDALVESKRRMIALARGATSQRRQREARDCLDRGLGSKLSRSVRSASEADTRRVADRPDWSETRAIPWITTERRQRVSRGDASSYIVDAALSISELGLANSAAELQPEGPSCCRRTRRRPGARRSWRRPDGDRQHFADRGSRGRCSCRRFLLLLLRATACQDQLRAARDRARHIGRSTCPSIESIRIAVPAASTTRSEIVDGLD